MANRRRGKNGKFVAAVRPRVRTVLYLTEKERRRLRELGPDETLASGIRWLLQKYNPGFYGVVEAEDSGLGVIDEQLWADTR